MTNILKILIFTLPIIFLSSCLSISGGLFLGRRYDLFKIHYHKTPLGFMEREIDHFGFSAGIFTGLGSTFMNSWVTNYHINSEYDGKGIAVLVGFNHLLRGWP